MEISLLRDILIVLGLSVIILLVCARVGVPSIVGLLVTGVIVGPHGFGLLHATHEVEMLAEGGVVLLLFTIGMEFSLTKLFKIGRMVMVGGALQVGLTIAVTWGLGELFGLPFDQALFLGFLASLSSTAIVLKALQEQTQIESPHGQMALAILIFQDIAVVPMILAVPILAGTGAMDITMIAVLLGKILGVLVFVWLAMKFIVPWLLHQIARTRSRELFVLSVVVLCFAIAWLTASVGLSLALGAFLAGLILSESPYSHHALGGIMPFRDVFTSLFFVSIGMLLDLDFLVAHPVVIGLAVVGVVIVKSGVVTVTGLALKMPLRNATQAGLAVGQVGEFAFVLASSGLALGLIGGDLYQGFLASSVLSMAITPLMIGIAPRAAKAMQKTITPKGQKTPPPELDATAEEKKLSDHIVVIGFGFTGHNIARAARFAGLRYTVIESNAISVKREANAGEPIFYGDATYTSVLEHAQVENARTVAVVINDPIATRQIIQTVREMNPDVHIIARTRFVREIGPLRELGATQVIPEEFETSIEISSRILAQHLVPRETITSFIEEVRRDEYQMYRNISEPTASLTDLTWTLPDVELGTVEVHPGSQLAGKTLAELDLRRRYGVTLLEVRNGEERTVNPAGDTTLQAGDVIVVVGNARKRRRLAGLAGGEMTAETRTGLEARH